MIPWEAGFSSMYEARICVQGLRPTHRNRACCRPKAPRGGMDVCHPAYQSDGERGEEPSAWLVELCTIQENLAQYAFGASEFREWEQKRNDWIYENNPFHTFVEQSGIYHLFSNCLGNVVADPVFHHGS